MKYFRFQFLIVMVSIFCIDCFKSGIFAQQTKSNRLKALGLQGTPSTFFNQPPYQDLFYVTDKKLLEYMFYPSRLRQKIETILTEYSQAEQAAKNLKEMISNEDENLFKDGAFLLKLAEILARKYDMSLMIAAGYFNNLALDKALDAYKESLIVKNLPNELQQIVLQIFSTSTNKKVAIEEIKKFISQNLSKYKVESNQFWPWMITVFMHFFPSVSPEQFVKDLELPGAYNFYIDMLSKGCKVA